MGYLHYLGNMDVAECGDLVRLCHYLQARNVGCVEVFGNRVPNITPRSQIWPIRDWVVFCVSMVDSEGDFRTVQIGTIGAIFPDNVAQSVREVWRLFAINVAARKGP